MVNPEVIRKHAVWFHGIAHYPVNVCMHCGYEDDPESYWSFDEDDDRICAKCEDREWLARELDHAVQR